MNVVCVKCGKKFVSIGKYFDDNFKDKPDEYICLTCRTLKEGDAVR